MILSSILGGITGLIGTGITSITNYKLKKLDIKDKANDRQFYLDKIDKESKYLSVKMDKKIDLTNTEYTGQERVINSKAFLETIKSENVKSDMGEKLILQLFEIKGLWKALSYPTAILLTIIFVLIEATRRSMRPAITIVYTIDMFYIAYAIFNYLGYNGFMEMLNKNNSTLFVNVIMLLIDTITYIASSSALFWIGSRVSEKTMDKMMNNKTEVYK